MYELRRINGYSIVAERQGERERVALVAYSTRDGIEYRVAYLAGLTSHHFHHIGPAVTDLSVAVASYDAA